MPARALKQTIGLSYSSNFKTRSPKSKNARKGIETRRQGARVERQGQGPKSKNARKGIETKTLTNNLMMSTINRPKSKNARKGIETLRIYRNVFHNSKCPKSKNARKGIETHDTK